MVRPRWSNIELAVIVFFASRGVKHEVCGELLKRRLPTASRNVTAVRGKLRSLREEHRMYDKDTKWDHEAVRKWTESLKLSEDDLKTACLKIEKEDRDLIEMVS
jgi:hypothetical protein